MQNLAFQKQADKQLFFGPPWGFLDKLESIPLETGQWQRRTPARQRTLRGSNHLSGETLFWIVGDLSQLQGESQVQAVEEGEDSERW
jgi:hypothetical protein